MKRFLLAPDFLYYKSIKFEEDALVQVSIGAIGVQRPRDGSAFYPKLNVNGLVYASGQKKPLFEDSVYFGIDADQKKHPEFFIGKDPKRGYGDFVNVIKNIESLKELYQKAIPLIAKQLAENMHQAINK